LIVQSFTSLKAQEDQVKGIVNTSRTTSNVTEGNAIRTFDSRYTGVKGHPYLFDTLQHVIATLKNESAFEIYGNVDLVKKEFVIIEDKKIRGVISLEEIIEFEIHDQIWKALNLSGEVILAHLLFIGDSLEIYRTHDKFLQKADFSGAYASGKTEDEFKPKSELLFLKDDSYNYFKMKYKELSIIFSLNQKQVKSRIKDSKLNLKSNQDEIKIFEILSAH